MFIAIENAVPQKAKTGRVYFSFWAKLFFDDEGSRAISVSGFKYFPDTKSVSTPSINKGDTKFINTSKLTAEMYNDIRQAAENAIDSQLTRTTSA